MVVTRDVLELYLFLLFQVRLPDVLNYLVRYQQCSRTPLC